MQPPCFRPLPSLRASAIALVVLGLALATAFAAPPAARASSEGFLVVAHEDVLPLSIDREDLSKLFLRQTRTWDDGTPVVALDQVESSPVRERFSREIHGRTVEAIKTYWKRTVFSGRDVPPEELAQAVMLERIAATPGAIGYVTTEAALPSGTKRIDVEDYPLDVPSAAGAVGAAAESNDPAEPLRGPAARTIESRLYDARDGESLQLLEIGPCGNGGGESGRRFAVVNRGEHSVTVKVQVSRWLDDTFRSSNVRSLRLEAGEEEDLGCDRRGRESFRFALAESRADAAPDSDPRPAPRRFEEPSLPAREAVEWVETGTCGRGAGTSHALRNRVLDRVIHAEVTVRETAPDRSRTYVRSIVLGPGAQKALGCSHDGSLERTFTLRRASYG